ncbi:MAG: M1 family aminopeptidase [Polyangiaceae bacterium]
MHSIAASFRRAAGCCRLSHDHDHDRHEHESELGGALVADARPAHKRFPFPGTKRVYERDRPFTIRHIALDLTIRLAERDIAGSATIDVERVREDAKTLILDAVEMRIARVLVDGAPVSFDYDDRELSVPIPRASTVDGRPARLRARVTVEYSAKPRRGLYFLAPDEHVQSRPTQAWTQFEDEDARFVFPCHDKPHIKQTTELRARVPAGLYCLSNGTLVERSDDGATSFFHYSQAEPHASYLVSIVVGDFAILEAPEETRVPVTYVVPKGREADGRRAFARTPDMIALFEKKTGVPFPYAKYAQVVVSDFIFGGMENTGATTMFEHILLDERADLDSDMDGLVAHELAHQWFGDLVTCRDFSEAWLNEGFATFMELVWKEEGTEPHDRFAPARPHAGREEYEYALKGELDVYFDEDGARYRRPIVCRDFDQPIDLFDRHLYQKGAAVLAALRHKVGDDCFWRGVRAYLEAHAHGVVETRDLQRALEAASGLSLDATFDAYVYGAGHPAFEVTIEVDRDPERTEISVAVKQTQVVDELTKLYRGPLEIDVASGGVVKRETVELRSPHDVFVLHRAERPDYVVIDPDGALLASFDVDAPADLARAQLSSARSARARWCAAAILKKRADDATVEALGKALRDEGAFWGVRAECADALSTIRSDGALDQLVAAISARHPKVRRAVARALGKFKHERACAALRPVSLGDPSYLVAGEAARAMGATRRTEAFDTLVELLGRPSHMDAIACGAIDGLAALREERAVPHLAALTHYGRNSYVRRAAMIALARLDTSRRTRELLEERLDDRDPFVRLSAVRALDLLGDVKARGALGRRLEREDAGNVKRRIREALRDLRAPREGELRALRDELEKVRDESKQLALRLVRLEARVGSPTRGARTKKAAKGSPAPKKKR